MSPIWPSVVKGGQRAYLICKFRGLYGTCPRQFHAYHMTLTPEGLPMQPGHIFRTSLPTVTITEDLPSARKRPFQNAREANQLGSTGPYRPGGPLEESGKVVLCCRTSHGLLEFAVERRED